MKAAVQPMNPELVEPMGEAPDRGAGVDVLTRLEGITAGRGMTRLAARLHDLAAYVASDMADFELAFGDLRRDPSVVGKAAAQLTDAGGKRLRPMCLMLAARLGRRDLDPRAFDLSVAIELVHNATLLHDDVVDVSDTRRGKPSARTIYGNAASIFAGDWLLIEALRRVHLAGEPALLNHLLAIIEEMIFAESIQLEKRGSLLLSRDDYFRVIEGKTASVFRWAMRAGGTIGGLDEGACEALEQYGRHLGVAFQAVDDLLDLTGDASVTGKALFADLREGKTTYPLILGLEREPALRLLLETIVAQPETTDEASARLIDTLQATDAVRDCLRLARDEAAQAIACLELLPPSQARRSLATVAEAMVDRDL